MILGRRWLVPAALIAVLAWPGSASATAPAGYNLYETDPATTQFSFVGEFAIPAGFFEQGSEPLTGPVTLGGLPIKTFEGKDVGDADTIVRRTETTDLVAPFPALDTVPLELAALSLQSVVPIRVLVAGRTQLWDLRVSASPTRPSKGAAFVSQTADGGGALASDLQVFPLFRFIRRSDKTVRAIDFGTEPLSALGTAALVFGAFNVPWRSGCTAPALAIPPLNDGFCPGQTIDGKNELTIERALVAKHGVYPVQPRLESFRCYGVAARSRFRRLGFELTDQFGVERVQVLRPLDLCAPVRAGSDPLRNRTAHLGCYAARHEPGSASPVTADVLVRNRFGNQRLALTRPRALCAASLALDLGRRKKRPARAALTDNFKCYGLKPVTGFRKRKLRVTDRFGRDRVTVAKPVLLCTPAQFEQLPVEHPVQHLVCYSLTRARAGARPQRALKLENQLGKRRLDLLRPRRLCVPSLKVPVSDQ